VKPDPKEIESVTKWQNMISAKRIRSFLGLASFYRKLIKDFSTLAKLFIDLLKKEGLFSWKGEQQKMFELLKRKLLSTSVL